MLIEETNRRTTVTYTILTFDVILGSISGVSGMIWFLMGLSLNNYETFAQQTSLLQTFYSIRKSDPEQDLLSELKQNRTFYEYSYCRYFFASFLNFCCCCCKRTPCIFQRTSKLKSHEASFEKLQGELDIVGIVKQLRVSAFVSELALTKS